MGTAHSKRHGPMAPLMAMAAALRMLPSRLSHLRHLLALGRQRSSSVAAQARSRWQAAIALSGAMVTASTLSPRTSAMASSLMRHQRRGLTLLGGHGVLHGRANRLGRSGAAIDPKPNPEPDCAVMVVYVWGSCIATTQHARPAWRHAVIRSQQEPPAPQLASGCTAATGNALQDATSVGVAGSSSILG